MGSLKAFADFRALFAVFPKADDFSQILLEKKIKELSFPNSALAGANSLGKSYQILRWLARWRGYDNMIINKPTIALYASSKDEPNSIETTKNIVENLQTGGVFVNSLCQVFNIMLRIYDLALDYPTMDISKYESMDERACAATMAFGLEAIASDIDLLGLSSINLGEPCINEKAIANILFKNSYENEVKHVIKLQQSDDSFEIIQKLGTRELAAITGAILAARMEKIPIVLEGSTALLAAALLKYVNSASIEHCLIGQLPNIDYYHKLADFIGRPVLLELDMESDCGAGLALALSIISSSALAFQKQHSFVKSKELQSKHLS